MSGLHTIEPSATSKSAKGGGTHSSTARPKASAKGLGNSSDVDSFGDKASNGTELGASDKSSSGSDAAGNTVFFLCIFAFVATALGLGLFLWRKHRQNKLIGQKKATGADGEIEDEDVKSSIANIFGKRKNRPSPLPLTTLNKGNETTLPPYSPYTAGAGQSPWLGGNFTVQGMKAAQAASETNEEPDSDTRSIRSTNTLSKARREAAERAGNLFSPFVPFSPVTAAPVADKSKDYSEDAEAIVGATSVGGYKPSSSLHRSVTMPQPSPVRYMDPEAAQAMGIHPDVVKEAEPGVSEAEIERRRARAQRRLEERQRAEEGSVVEDSLNDGPRFKHYA